MKAGFIPLEYEMRLTDGFWTCLTWFVCVILIYLIIISAFIDKNNQIYTTFSFLHIGCKSE